MTADDGLKKRQIHPGRVVLIVLVAAIASMVVVGGAYIAYVSYFLGFENGDLSDPVLFLRHMFWQLLPMSLIGGLMAGASMFVWHRPGVIRGLWSILFVLGIPLAWFLARSAALYVSGHPLIGARLFFQNFDLLYLAAVWTIPLLSSVLSWRLGVLLGTMILVAATGFSVWTGWQAVGAPTTTGGSDLLLMGALQRAINYVLPVLTGFMLARLMLPRRCSRPVTTATTVPSSL